MILQVFIQLEIFVLNQQKVLQTEVMVRSNFELQSGRSPIIRVIWKWPDLCHVIPRGMTCIPLSFTPRISLTNQRHVHENDCITSFYEQFNSGFQTNKNQLWRHQSALRAKGLAWYSTDVYGFFSQNLIVSSLFELEMSFYNGPFEVSNLEITCENCRYVLDSLFCSK